MIRLGGQNSAVMTREELSWGSVAWRGTRNEYRLQFKPTTPVREQRSDAVSGMTTAATTKTTESALHLPSYGEP